MTDVARLIQQCPSLAGLPAAERNAVAGQAIAMAAPAGTLLFDTGHACQALPLVISGAIRVFKRAENGREISLYRVRRGELCIVTVSCLLGGDAYPATGVAETEVTAIALPRPLFLRLPHRSRGHPFHRQSL